MVRARVEVAPGPAPVYYEEGPYYYNEWYGPGVYYGIYFTDYPTYYSWQRQHYYSGPYYWRYNHHDYEWNRRYQRRHN